MRRRTFIPIFTGVVALGSTGSLWAITGGPKDFVCPLCKTKNKFWVWFSWGSYIYHFPSRFQLVFWPYTDTKFLFHCKKCRLTAFSDDFQKPPQDKLAATRDVLRDVKIVYDTGDYETTPMFERLEVAEKVYGIWGLKDSEWCHFYRVKGYHLQGEKQQAGADSARQRALDLALKLYADPDQVGERKESLTIMAAMRHYLRDDKQALQDLRAASELTYTNPKLKEEQSKNYDGYLSALIRDYVDALENGKSTDEKEEKEPPKVGSAP